MSDSDPTSMDSEWLEHAYPVDEAPGAAQRLGDFELLREIGRGGMGVVYEAQQVSLKRRVALKVLPPMLGLSTQAIQRFEREALAAAKLHHTNIVPVYAIGEHDCYHFYAMELVEGDSLDQIVAQLKQEGTNPLLAETVNQTADALQTKTPDPGVSSSTTTSISDSSVGGREWFDTVARLLAEVADALHYAHGRGVIHRDIKPANLMLSEDGRLIVTDFGLARVSQETSLTLSGSFMGTPAYMSPEQVVAGRMGLDHRTDVYSLGVVLYELLTLHRAYAYETREEVLAAIMTRDPRRPRRFNSRIPVDLETICLKAMEKAPDRRYATAGRFANDLRQFLGRGLIAARRAGPIRRTLKALRRHPVATTIGISLVVLLAALASFGLRTSQLETREEVQRALADAKMHLSAGLYREGLERIEHALALDPDVTAARLVGAHLLMKLGRTREAVQEAQALLREDPDDWTAHLILSSAAEASPWISAEEHIRVVEKHAPDSADAYHLRSLIADSSKDRLALLDRALDLDPGHADALLDRADLYTNVLRDHPAALRDCELLTAIRPRSTQGRRMRARVFLEQQDHGAALEAIERAVLLDPEDAANYEVRALIHAAMGRTDEAIRDFSRAIELEPRHPPLYERRARALNDLGQFQRALEDARKALHLDPDRRSAYDQVFYSLLRLDRNEELREALDRLQAAADGWADKDARSWAYREIAEQLQAMREYEQALDVAGQAIQIDPRNFRNHAARARIHHALGHEAEVEADCNAIAAAVVTEPTDLIQRSRILDWDCRMWEQAVEDSNRVVERFPNWYEAYLVRGSMLSSLNRNEEALADLNRAIELAPNNANAYANRGVLLEETGRLEEVVKDYDKAIELAPHLSYALYSNRGYARFELGRIDEALQDLDHAIRLDPRSISGYAGRGTVLASLGRCAEALQDLSRAEEFGSGEFYLHRNLAWAHVYVLFYDCPGQFDSAAALEHARQAREVVPDAIELLGHALFRAGRHEQAMQMAQEAFQHYEGEGAWFLLTMCAWQLGQTEEARRYFDRSVAWMERNKPDSPVLIRQREEASEMLGLSPGGPE